MIRMNAFEAEPRTLRDAQEEACRRVLNSGQFILGPEVAAFEKQWAEYCGVPHCVGVANGMQALTLGLRALGIGPGDEVITTPTTAMATVMAVMESGATPVLADISLATALLDPESAERCLTTRTKAILLVHLYGQMPGMTRWAQLCRKAGIHLLEDAAQAHGASDEGKRAGSLGSWAGYSFYPTKNFGARGDAGAFVTSSAELAARVQRLRHYGAAQRDHHVEPGYNSRLDEMQAAILRARLPFLDQFNQRRREVAARYHAGIRNPNVELLAPPASAEHHVYHLFVVRCRERDRLARFLADRQIETLVHYPVPAHQQPCCAKIRTDPGGLPNAEQHARECLSLPCHPQLSDEEVDRVIAAVNEFG
jgi:dTDP-4-amino-4,6-dideoxygalactose transaminase